MDDEIYFRHLLKKIAIKKYKIYANLTGSTLRQVAMVYWLSQTVGRGFEPLYTEYGTCKQCYYI
jgi:hypothetical protein